MSCVEFQYSSVLSKTKSPSVSAPPVKSSMKDPSAIVLSCSKARGSPGRMLSIPCQTQLGMRKWPAHILEVLLAAPRDGRPVDVGAAFAGLNGTLVVGLCDVERCAIGLASCLDGTRAELLEVDAAVGHFPVHSALVSDEDLVSVNLCMYRWEEGREVSMGAISEEEEELIR